jgi:thiol-disulfide isomerase/thioredoxin
MPNRSISLLLLYLALLGCGKSEDKTDNAVVDVGKPSANTANDSATAGDKVAPPGLIEMPPGVDPQSLPTSPPPSDGKGEGIVMPPINPNTAPVIAQRPILDEPTNAKEIKLTAATLESVLQRVAESKKVCVVDIWSLSCEPCLKEFPGLVRLNQELAGNVTCFSLNVDFVGRKTKPPETYRSPVTGFLQSSSATFENFLCETPSDEVFAKLKIVSIPAVLIYDANGNLVRAFTDTGDDIGFSYEKDIAPLVRTLVAK